MDYVRLAATATRLIQGDGQPIVLLRNATADDYDPVTGVDPTVDTDTPYPLYAVVGPITVSYAMKAQGAVQVQDQLLYLEPSIVAPILSDKIYIHAQAWSIVHIDALSPAGIPLLYTIQIRP